MRSSTASKRSRWRESASIFFGCFFISHRLSDLQSRVRNALIVFANRSSLHKINSESSPLSGGNSFLLPVWPEAARHQRGIKKLLGKQGFYQNSVAFDFLYALPKLDIRSVDFLTEFGNARCRLLVRVIVARLIGLDFICFRLKGDKLFVCRFRLADECITSIKNFFGNELFHSLKWQQPFRNTRGHCRSRIFNQPFLALA